MAGGEHNKGDATSSSRYDSYVEGVTSDIDQLNKYANASQIGDRKTMIECFNSISWGDQKVKDHLPKYCEADPVERQLIDDIYRVICPSFDRVQGPSFNTMSLWLKARLHMQHQKTPFSSSTLQLAQCTTGHLQIRLKKGLVEILHMGGPKGGGRIYKVAYLPNKLGLVRSFDAATTASVNDENDNIISGARFNQDSSCLAVCSHTGFLIYNCNPFAWACERNLSSKAQGGIHIVEMMYRCNIVAIVGATEAKRSYANDRKSIPWNRNVLIIWDDKKGSEVAQLIFGSAIRNVKLLRKLIIVALDNEVYVYQLKNVELLNTFKTCFNPQGICSVAPNGSLSIVAYPAIEIGTVNIHTYHLDVGTDVIALRGSVNIKAHIYDIYSISLTFDGMLMTTASRVGGFIRLWNLFTAQKLQEFKTPSKCGHIKFCQISQDTRYLLTISAKDVVSVFKIKIKYPHKGSRSCCLSDRKSNASGFILRLVEKTKIYFQSSRAFARYKVQKPITACTFLPNTNNILLVLEDKSVLRLGIYGQIKLLAKHTL